MKFGEYQPVKGHLPAISIRQPWAWLIAHSLKDIENRGWRTNYRGPLLIHAGQKIDPACFDGDEIYSPEFYLAGADPYIRGKILLRKDDYPTGGIVGIAELVDIVKESESRWFIGPYGFVLRDAKSLPFTPYKGELGLFPVPESVLENEETFDPTNATTPGGYIYAMEQLERKESGKPHRPKFWRLPNAPVWVTIDKETLPATVLECAHLGDFNGDWCKLELTKTVDGWDGPITRTWVHPKPIQSYKLKKRVV